MELKTVFERYHASNDTESPHGAAGPTLDVIRDENDPVISRRGRAWMPRRGLALALLVVALGALAAILWPDSLKALLHRHNGDQVIGVPDASKATVAQNATAIPEQTVASANQAPSPAPPAPAEGPNDSAGSAIDSDPQQPAVTQDANAGAAITSSETSSQPSVTEKQADIPTSVTTRAPAKTKAVTSTVPRRLFASPNRSLHRGSARARVLGTTPDGSLILGLPSGRTVVVAAPAMDFVPRHRARYIPFERRAIFLPPPPSFVPVFPPGY